MINLEITNPLHTPFWLGTHTRLDPLQSITVREDSLSQSMADILRRAELINLIKIRNTVDDEDDVAIRVNSHVLTQADNQTRIHLLAEYSTTLYVNANTLGVGFRCGVSNDQLRDVSIVPGEGMAVVPRNGIIPAESAVDLMVTRTNRLIIAVPVGELEHDHPADGELEWTGKYW